MHGNKLGLFYYIVKVKNFDLHQTTYTIFITTPRAYGFRQGNTDRHPKSDIALPGC